MSKIDILVLIQLITVVGLLVLTIWNSETSGYEMKRVSDGPFEVNPAFNRKNVAKMSLVVSTLAITTYLILFLNYINLGQVIILIASLGDGVLIFKEMKRIDGQVKMINSVYDSLSDEEKERYRNLDK